MLVWPHLLSIFLWEGPCDVVAYVPGYNLVLKDFKLQSLYYDHFQTNTLKEDMKPLYPF